jgi:hypothetical protein
MRGDVPRRKPMPSLTRMGQAPQPPCQWPMPNARRALDRTQDQRGTPADSGVQPRPRRRSSRRAGQTRSGNTTGYSPVSTWEQRERGGLTAQKVGFSIPCWRLNYPQSVPSRAQSPHKGGFIARSNWFCTKITSDKKRWFVQNRTTTSSVRSQLWYKATATLNHQNLGRTC